MPIHVQNCIDPSTLPEIPERFRPKPIVTESKDVWERGTGLLNWGKTSGRLTTATTTTSSKVSSSARLLQPSLTSSPSPKSLEITPSSPLNGYRKATPSPTFSAPATPRSSLAISSSSSCSESRSPTNLAIREDFFTNPKSDRELGGHVATHNLLDRRQSSARKLSKEMGDRSTLFDDEKASSFYRRVRFNSVFKAKGKGVGEASVADSRRHHRTAGAASKSSPSLLTSKVDPPQDGMETSPSIKTSRTIIKAAATMADRLDKASYAQMWGSLKSLPDTYPLDSLSSKEEIPRSWKEYLTLYRMGAISLSDPPPIPLNDRNIPFDIALISRRRGDHHFFGRRQESHHAMNQGQGSRPIQPFHSTHRPAFKSEPPNSFHFLPTGEGLSPLIQPGRIVKAGFGSPGSAFPSEGAAGFHLERPTLTCPSPLSSSTSSLLFSNDMRKRSSQRDKRPQHLTLRLDESSSFSPFSESSRSVSTDLHNAESTAFLNCADPDCERDPFPFGPYLSLAVKGGMEAPLPPFESQRLESLYSYRIERFVGALDSNVGQEQVLGGGGRAPSAMVEEFLSLCRRSVLVLSHMVGVKEARITLIDRDQVWMIAQSGMGRRCLGPFRSRSKSLESHLLLNRNEGLVILDAASDPRFADLDPNPVVSHGLDESQPSEPEQAREDNFEAFYAGMPILSSKGFPIGAISVSDSKPRRLWLTRDQSHLDLLAKELSLGLERVLEEDYLAKATLFRQGLAEFSKRAIRSGLSNEGGFTVVGMDRPSSEDGRMEDLSYALQLITDACQIEAAYLAQSLGGGEGEQSLSNWEPMCLYGNALGKSVEQNTGLDPEVHSHAVKEPLVFQHVELGDDLGKREAVLPWDYTGSEGQKFRAACLVPCRHGDGREECQLHWVLVALSTDPRRVFFSYELDFIKQFAALMVPVLMTTDVSQVRSPRKVEAIQRPSRKLTVVDRNNSRSTGSSPRMDCTGLPPRIVIPDEQDGERRLGITGTKKGRGLIGKGRGLRLSSDDVDSEINGFSDSDSEVSSDSQELPSFLLSNVDRLRESLGTRFGHDARMGSRKVEEDAAPASPSFGGGLQTSIFSNLCEPIPPPRDAAGNLIPDGSLTIQAGQGRSSSDSDHVTPEWGPPFITEGRIKEAGRKVASLFSGPWQSSHVHQHPSHATVVGQSRAWPVSSRLRYEDRRSPCISPWEKAASNTHPVSSLRRPATGIDSANDHRRLRLQSDRPGKMQGQLESPRCELEKQVRKIPSADDASLSSLAPNRDLDGERGQLKNHPSTGSFIVMGWESHRDARVEERRPNADVWAISTSRKEGPLASPTGTTYQGIEPGETKAVQDGSRRSSMARMVPGRSVLSMTFDQEEEGAYWVRRGSFSEGEVDGKELSQVDSTEGKALSFPDHLPGNVNLETSSNVVEGGGTKIYMTESQVASTEGFEMVM